MKQNYEQLVSDLVNFRLQHKLLRSTMAHFCGLDLEGWNNLEELRTTFLAMRQNDKFWEAMLLEFEISKVDIEDKEFQLILKL